MPIWKKRWETLGNRSESENERERASSRAPERKERARSVGEIRAHGGTWSAGFRSALCFAPDSPLASAPCASVVRPSTATSVGARPERAAGETNNKRKISWIGARRRLFFKHRCCSGGGRRLSFEWSEPWEASHSQDAGRAGEATSWWRRGSASRLPRHNAPGSSAGRGARPCSRGILRRQAILRRRFLALIANLPPRLGLGRRPGRGSIRLRRPHATCAPCRRRA